jgi:hypothetical protein
MRVNSWPHPPYKPEHKAAIHWTWRQRVLDWPVSMGRLESNEERAAFAYLMEMYADSKEQVELVNVW